MPLWLSIPLLAAALVWGPAALAQTDKRVEKVHLDDIHPGPGGERVVELYVRALTRYGEPVGELRASDVVIRDNAEKIDPGDIELAPSSKLLRTLAETGRGMSCVIAIDVSRTMKGEPFTQAKAAALEFLGKLESRDRVAVVAFSDEARVVVPFTASREAARVELEQLEVDSDSLSTVLYDGIHQGVELLRAGRDLPRRSFVILFSDGKDAGSQRSLEQVVEKAQSTETRPPTLVFSIGYARFGGEGLDVLRRLSEQTGGDFLHAASTIHLRSFFNGIWDQMKKSYVIRYPGDMDGEPHKVEIEIEGQVDSRTTPYPDIRRPIWPYVGVVAAVALLGLVAALIARGRAAGRLVFSGGPRAGEEIVIKAARTRIGALADNDVVIASNTVSRYHAVLHRKGRRVEIEDLNSRNGTFVNGSAVRTSPLRPGDKIRVADVDLVFER